MNFRDSYKAEMDNIKHNSNIDDVIMAEFDDTGKAGIRRISIKRVAVVCAIILAVIVAANFDVVSGVARSIFGTFGLSVGHKQMELDDINPVEFDIETFCRDNDTIYDVSDDNGESYWQVFSTYEEFYNITSLSLPGAENITYKDINLDVNKTYFHGQITMVLCYKDKEIYINGMFALEGLAEDTWGYGTASENKIIDVYEYGNGKKAYFVKDDESFVTVYFSEGDILFQMFLGQDKSNRKIAKEIIDLMAS